MIKTRVYEVARELGLDNRELVTKLATLGIPVRNHMSSIDPADADRVKRAIEKEKQQNVYTSCAICRSTLMLLIQIMNMKVCRLTSAAI